MLPSIDLRIDNVIKALEQVILPALTKRERLAKDQVKLCIGHLQMIGQQWRWAAAFEAQSFDSMIALADEMLPLVDTTYADPLENAIASAKAVDQRDLGMVEQGITSLGSLIDRIILGDDGKVPLRAELWDAVLAYGEVQALRERSWFALTGLDPDRNMLPSIEEVMTQ